jgi:hypothetical protein
MFSCYALDFWVGAKFIQQGVIADPTDFFYVLMSLMMGATSVGQATAFAPNLAEAQVCTVISKNFLFFVLFVICHLIVCVCVGFFKIVL